MLYPQGHDQPQSHQALAGLAASLIHPLLVALHREAWGGEKVFQLLAKLAENPGANRDILELMYVCLALGFEGRYREVTPQDRIVRTFEWDGMPGYVSVESADFEDLGDGRTRMVSTVQFLTKEERDGMLDAHMEEGMNESYAALDRVLAAQRR